MTSHAPGEAPLSVAPNEPLLKFTHPPSYPSATSLIGKKKPKTKPIRTYLGKKRLEKALSQYQQQHPPSPDSTVVFTLTFLPYQLQPAFPADEERDRRSWLSELHHGGSEEATAAFAEKMAALGAEDGIAFKSLSDGVVANTLEAHRVLHCLQEPKSARGEGAVEPSKFVDSVYASYFENGCSPSSR